MRSVVEFVTDLVFSAAGVWKAKGGHRADGEQEDLKGETAWHFGFYSRPKDGARGVVLKADGHGNTSFLVGYRDKQYELTLEKGEVGLKNAFDASLVLKQNGDISVDPKAGSKVLLAGGADNVATKKDLSFLYFAITQAVAVANDGGANLKATLLGSLAAGGWTSDPGDSQCGSAVVKASRT